MGRGRQKAKQTKVARELKYTSHHMDIDALRRELSADTSHDEGAAAPHDQESEPAR
ncbi:DUF3073 domain-containing protein [Nonomuraea sp. NPDC050790]|uniref:DUF3073 domain-containing protein n=1 Tax=Nonomuraea sp. NPDC050790 TaxID=3364371 RepID=UPI00379B7D56